MDPVPSTPTSADDSRYKVSFSSEVKVYMLPVMDGEATFTRDAHHVLPYFLGNIFVPPSAY